MTNKAGNITFPSKIGVFWNSEPWPIRDSQSMAREIESLGYGSLFMPEGSGKDVLVESAAFLSATDRLVVGTGIANVHVRVPSAAESGARMLTALYPGRFVLGLGVSHAPSSKAHSARPTANPCR
ncbi:LLM class flavin-dependent oxidoreductase [Williamsia soli]|uniref:LLM class flavin-dependent oxidoreductase n=1 Tax=Williamsia soli TaxID=364929 RepID=UPI001F30E7F4|nr:LLM class flavin-dependent oxidoreductase [Williamsia soli]